MIVCPKCQHVWESTLEPGATLPDLLACPNCGQTVAMRGPAIDDPTATLPAVDDQAAVTIVSGERTVHDSNGSATIVSGEHTLDVSDGTATVVSGEKTLDQSPGAATIVSGDQTLVPTSGEATIDISTLNDASMATLDADSQWADARAAGSASADDPTATREFDPLATANFHLSVSGDATLDGSHSDSDPRRATNVSPLGRTRRGTLADDSPLTSIGTHSGGRSIKHVSVSNRKIASDEHALGENADYRLLHKLGEGAMGVVYAARQCSIDRIVAIKAIKKANEGQRDSREKFLYEAQITGDLDHPNIVPIHELGENDDGTLFYAMKMVSGTPWQKVIRTRSREENIETLMKVADAIAFAHAKRVIHRDLKPENIMLGSFGEVLVMDWGLAVPLDRNVPFSLGGTPAYMAPEMAAHIVAKIGPASDVYLLGAILFQIVTGVPPHPGTTGTECLLAAVRNHFVDFSSDDALLRIARKAMESEPSDRYASVIEFQEAIRQYKRHSESIAITGRSRHQARQAKENQDYEGFSRAIFGFQDALALWDENAEAQQALQKTKLEYARCAFAKSDYDLCLGTLDGVQEPLLGLANELRQQALAAKQAMLDKERRFVWMRRVLAAVVLVAVTSLSGLSLFLYSARNTILSQNTRLEKQRNDLAEANLSEQSARLAAEKAQSTAEAAAKRENQARQVAENALKAEQAARAEREVALKNEQAAKAEETKQRMLAQASAEEAVQARNAEARAAQQARRSALLSRLGEYQTGLNLALAQTSRNDLPHSQQQLRFISDLEKTLEHPAPQLRNWLYRRVNTLNNADLPQAKLAAPPTCASTWPWLNMVALGDEAGNIYLQRTDSDASATPMKITNDDIARVIDLALAPDGKWLVSLHKRRDGSSSTLFWNLSSERPTARPLNELKQAAIQQCEFSPDGKYLVAGNSGGLCVLPLTEDGQWKELRRLPMKGELISLAWQPGNQAQRAVALVQQATDERLLYHIDLQKLQCEPAFLPEEISRQATCVALPNPNDVLLGDSQGRVFQVSWPVPASVKTNATNLTSQRTATVDALSEISGLRQYAAIVGLHLDKRGDLLILSDSTAASTYHWQAEQEQWVRRHNLLGLTGNLRAAVWLDDSRSILAADERGSVILWNLAEQSRRERTAPHVDAAEPKPLPTTLAYAAIDDQSQSATAIDRDAAIQRWHLRTGLIERQSDGAVWSYVGHTPGAQLHDWAIDRKHSILATSCRLPADTAKDKLPLASASAADTKPNFEFCVWDLASGNMLQRWQTRLSSGGRIALADSAHKLIVTDADRTLCFDLGARSPSSLISEPTTIDFGASLAVTHPVASHQVMLLRATGAGVVWDVSQSRTAPPEQSRDFNLATANRFAPLDGAWNSNGTRFYCLLENGQIGRFEWDAGKLTFDRLSSPDKRLACNQQTLPWQFVDVFVPDETAGQQPRVDALLVNIRQPNLPHGACQQIEWAPSSPEPQLTDSKFPVRALPSGETSVDVCPLSPQELLLFDRAARAFRLTIADDRFSDSVGRTDFVSATADRAGARWFVLGAHDQLWQVDRQTDGSISWQRQRIPLSGMQAVDLSWNGRHLLVRSAKAQQTVVSLIDVSTQSVMASWPGATCVAWHPQRSLLACLHPADKSIRTFDIELGSEQSAPCRRNWTVQLCSNFDSFKRAGVIPSCLRGNG